MANHDHRPYSLPHGTGGWWPNQFMGSRVRLRASASRLFRIGYDTTLSKTADDRASVERFRSVGLTGRYVWVVAAEDNEPIVGYSLPGAWESGNPRGLAEYSAIGIEHGTPITASARRELGGTATAEQKLANVVRVEFVPSHDGEASRSGAVFGTRRTFILTWNPELWPTTGDEQAEYQRTWDDQAERSASGEAFDDQWSTGSRTRDIMPGDRAFLLRQRRDRGFVAAGEFISTVYQGPHWNGTDTEANYAAVRWTSILPVPDRLPVEELSVAMPAVTWDRMQGSGVQVRTLDDQRRLEELWESHLDSVGRLPWRLPDELIPTETFSEGAVSRVEVNRYERDPRARSACLDHWGHACTVCGFDFGAQYGPIGDGYIHVHHLRELSSLGAAYEIDPVHDMRPVCPNCHAMLHRERPALSVAKLQARLRK